MSVHRTLPSPKAARSLPRLLPLLAALTLAACGGGGGGEAPPADAPAPAPVPQGTAALLAGSTTENGCVDGPAATARFGSPQGIALDDAGNILVADGACNAIRQIAPDGTVSTFAGKLGEADDVQGAAASVRFKEPFGLNLNKGLNLLHVADRGAHRVLSVSLVNRSVISVAGNGVAGGLGDDSNPNGNDANAVPLRAQNEMRFNGPAVIASCLGVLCVSDLGNEVVQVIGDGPPLSTVFTFLREAPVGLVTPVQLLGRTVSDVLFSRNSALFSSIGNGETPVVFAGDAGEAASVDGVGTAARFLGPVGLARGLGDTLLVADRTAIRHVDRNTAEVTTVLRGADQFGGEPRQIVVAADGNTYFYTTPRGVVKATLP